MPRPRSLTPAYSIDKATGRPPRAFVKLDGRKHYLGPANSQESRDAYHREIAEWIARGRRPAPSPDAIAQAAESPTVTAVVAAFWKHAQTAYPAEAVAEGRHPRGELGNFRAVLRILKRLYGPTPAKEFGPLRLKAVRAEMIAMGWCRNVVNRQTGRLKHVFKWGVENEMVPGGVAHALAAVAGLRSGRSDARESVPVTAVADSVVDAVLPIVSRQVKAMIELQLLTGMRPGEACAMRGRNLDTGGKLWVYRPEKHKTQHHGHARTVYLGPKAREIVEKFLRADLAAPLFSPAEAEAEWRAANAAKSKTPRTWNVTPWAKVAKPKRRASDRYNTGSYLEAIVRACDLAFPPPAHLARGRVASTGRKAKSGRLETTKEWRGRLGDKLWAELGAWRRAHRWHPNQLRHNAATRFRKDYGIEAARVLLGHRTMAVTEMYAERDVAAAMRIMSEVG